LIYNWGGPDNGGPGIVSMSLPPVTSHVFSTDTLQYYQANQPMPVCKHLQPVQSQAVRLLTADNCHLINKVTSAIKSSCISFTNVLSENVGT